MQVTKSNLNNQRKIPGGIPIWIFIFAEMVEFGLFFIVFIVVKQYFPEDFREGINKLNINFAIINTIFLITSSYFIAQSVKLLREGSQKAAIKKLLVTLLLAFAYCISKYFEYEWNEQNGIGINTNYFFTCYYYLTFNHLLHVLIAIFILIISLIQLITGNYNKNNSNGYEGVASYWHMIDLVWLILFPLLYILV